MSNKNIHFFLFLFAFLNFCIAVADEKPSFFVPELKLSWKASIPFFPGETLNPCYNVKGKAFRRWYKFKYGITGTITKYSSPEDKKGTVHPGTWTSMSEFLTEAEGNRDIKGSICVDKESFDSTLSKLKKDREKAEWDKLREKYIKACDYDLDDISKIEKPLYQKLYSGQCLEIGRQRDLGFCDRKTFGWCVDEKEFNTMTKSFDDAMTNFKISKYSKKQLPAAAAADSPAPAASAAK